MKPRVGPKQRFNLWGHRDELAQSLYCVVVLSDHHEESLASTCAANLRLSQANRGFGDCGRIRTWMTDAKWAESYSGTTGRGKLCYLVALAMLQENESLRMECPTAQALLEDFSAATMEYFDAADKLSNLVGSHDQFLDAQQSAKQAFHSPRQSYPGGLSSVDLSGLSLSSHFGRDAGTVRTTQAWGYLLRNRSKLNSIASIRM
jgi:hypothetical protein